MAEKCLGLEVVQDKIEETGRNCQKRGKGLYNLCINENSTSPVSPVIFPKPLLLHVRGASHLSLKRPRLYTLLLPISTCCHTYLTLLPDPFCCWQARFHILDWTQLSPSACPVSLTQAELVADSAIL